MAFPKRVMINNREITAAAVTPDRQPVTALAAAVLALVGGMPLLACGADPEDEAVVAAPQRTAAAPQAAVATLEATVAAPATPSSAGAAVAAPEPQGTATPDAAVAAAKETRVATPQPVVAPPKPAAVAAAETPMAAPKAFAMCAACHTVSADSGHGMGPNLVGIINRRAGTASGFAYSPALRQARIVWSEPELDRFLANPTAAVPGTLMMYDGLADAGERRAVIDYLKQLN